MNDRAIADLKTWPVFLINLKSRTDRLADTHAQLRACSWSELFQWPTTFQAINGWALPLPEHLGGGMSGAYGCKRSHEECLGAAIENNQPGIIMLEDDFEVLRGRDFVGEMKRFLSSVPDDWELLLPGYQPWDGVPEKMNDRVLKLPGMNRTHFYIATLDFCKTLYRHFVSTSGHADHLISAICKAHKVYGPRIQIAGQRASWSDIEGKDKGSEHWIMGGDRRPILILHAPDDVVEEMARQKLLTVLRPDDLHIGKLRGQIEKSQVDALAAGSVVAIVHPHALAMALQPHTLDPVFSVCAASIDEAMERLPVEIKMALGV
jgi:hypothetical protein